MPLNWEMFLFGINKELRERAAGQAEVEDGASSGPWGIWDTCAAGLPRVLKLIGAVELQQGLALERDTHRPHHSNEL